MDKDFTQKMNRLREGLVNEVAIFFKDQALVAHLLGSMAHGTNDALSDIDIWITFEDNQIRSVLENRFELYSQFGEIILWNEMPNNFPLNGVQTGIIYKIENELVRVDFYLCPHSSSRIMPNSKILFEKKKVEKGEMIFETKHTHQDSTDCVTFLISMCFIGIKKIVRDEEEFIDFLMTVFRKYEDRIPELAAVSKGSGFTTLRNALNILDSVSNSEQKIAINEISGFMTKVETLSELSNQEPAL